MLINCPNCGKPVSDQAKACMHCNYSLSVVTEAVDTKNTEEKVISKERKEYNELEKSKRKEMFMRFGLEEPLQYKTICSNKNLNNAQFILVMIAALVSIVGIGILIIIGKDRLDVPNPGVIDFLIAFGTIALGLLLFGVDTILNIKEKSTKQKFIIASQRFEKWLNKRNVEGFAESHVYGAQELKRLSELDND